MMEVTLSDHDQLFLPVIWTCVQQYHRADDGHTRSQLKECVMEIIRKWTNRPVSFVSTAVISIAEAHKSSVNVFNLMWPQRRIFNQSSGSKSLMVFEHTTPISETVLTLLECISIDDAIKMMKDYSGVCWITREEDDLLNAHGYRSRRPGGWQRCYAECDIKVLTAEEYAGGRK